MAEDDYYDEYWYYDEEYDYYDVMKEREERIRRYYRDHREDSEGWG